ncbi:MAG: dTDP-4-dehydrorhamnose reductase [Gammaproteobacteria bacterium]
MKVLITGAAGQLGTSLMKTALASCEIFAKDTELDIRDPTALNKAVQTFRPDVIVNAAAYTAVDKAESERELAFAINAGGTENLGRAALKCGARLIHISTDFVFDGKKSSPYLPADEMHPLGVYGASKAEGEIRLRTLMGNSAVILRTGWLYAAEGHNFVNTMLHLMAGKESLRIIADQVGTPTWAVPLATLVWKLTQHSSIEGTHHWSDAGVASWYDFAVAIQEEALSAGLLEHALPIEPIATQDYLLPARRPAYSVLDKQSMIVAAGITPVHWRVHLRKMLGEMHGP